MWCNNTTVGIYRFRVVKQSNIKKISVSSVLTIQYRKNVGFAFYSNPVSGKCRFRVIYNIGIYWFNAMHQYNDKYLSLSRDQTIQYQLNISFACPAIQFPYLSIPRGAAIQQSIFIDSTYSNNPICGKYRFGELKQSSTRKISVSRVLTIQYQKNIGFACLMLQYRHLSIPRDSIKFPWMGKKSKKEFCTGSYKKSHN